MDVVLAAVGKLKAGPERELCARYLERARKNGRGLGLRGFEVEEFPESRAARSSDRIAEEARVLLGRIGASGRAVCLDAKGDLLDSEALAALLSDNASASVKEMLFVIGGPDGLGKSVLARADRRISFGRLTWPHQIARVLLAEQLYRAGTILSGHPYHRA
jgi:23S rRNA (pseudouridine1915-N3)-methyltransferase